MNYTKYAQYELWENIQWCSHRINTKDIITLYDRNTVSEFFENYGHIASILGIRQIQLMNTYEYLKMTTRRQSCHFFFSTNRF